MIKPLLTERLLLQPIADEDRDFILTQFSDPDVTRFMYDEAPFREISEADKLISNYLQGVIDGTWRWVIICLDTHEKIGTCGFHHWDTATNSIEVGYDLAQIHWNNGLMYEAMTAAMAFARHTLRVQRFDAVIAVENIKSIRLAEKLGFNFSGDEFWETFEDRQYLHRRYSTHK